MSMTVLEATVEITKVVLSSSTQGANMFRSHQLQDELLEGVGLLYTQFKELEEEASAVPKG